MVAVVGGTLALASPDGGTSAPSLAPASSASPSSSSTDPVPVPTDTVAEPTPQAADDDVAPPDAAVPAAPVADYLELPPVTLDAPADYGNGTTARVVGLAAVQAEAHGVGEVSGPAVAVTVELTAGSEQVDLGDVVVNLYGPSAAAAPVVAGDPHHEPFAGVLRAGSSARATYVLRPAEPDAVARITVAYSGAVPAATFEGPLP
ncbi:hypothetical protein [Cellulomonas sp. S1-8]|uniref:hypothetical protein n=1 Tax=Cellulomonas sp. S1-8 TaxID=2904790 RepID=UPI0022443667|nr:hypothetical protein [Cellulomonas sp. S1-8]UZN04314.1 hypothetical protein OKX07_05105 [Cellulomonas sp. S1-8]